MSMKSTPTAKMRLAFLEAARPMLVFGILGNEAGFLWRREGKEKILAGLAPRNALISLDSVPETEGNGKIWKPLSRRLCEKTRFDCGVQRVPGAF